MTDQDEDLDRLLARWVLGRVAREEAVHLAMRALEDGCDDVGVAVIAGSGATTRCEIEDHLPDVLRARKRRLPSADEALKVLVDDCARQIANGEVDPVRGPWTMWDFWANENEGRRFFDQVRLFVDLASECENGGPHIAAYRRDIVEEAEAFLARGGLLLPL